MTPEPFGLNDMPHSEKTRTLIELDRLHVWHPFTAMRQWRESDPLIIASAQQFHLVDTEGRRYIDGVSSLWCNVHGHRVPQIDNAIRRQLDKVAHSTLLGLGSESSILLAAQLARRAPKPTAPQARPLTKIFYSDAGSTALEAAFKMAVGFFYHTGKPQKTRFIGFGGGYHGDTTGSMSVGYSEYFHRPFASMVFPTTLAPMPDYLHPPDHLRHLLHPAHATDRWPSERADLAAALRDDCLQKLDEELTRRAEQTAAIVIEPIMQGAAGMVCQPQGFLRGVADLARKHDVLLIADEVATGFGRTGLMFACEHEQVMPDILCLAKGITAGYLPLAATLTTDRIEAAFTGAYSENRTFFHGHTYTGNALACAAALASLELFDSSNLLGHIQRSASIIADRLSVLRDPAAFPHVIDVRQRGIMVGIELCKNRATREMFDSTQRTGAAVCMAMRPKGLVIRPLGDTLVLMPIPAMDDATLHRMLDIVIETLGAWKS